MYILILSEKRVVNCLIVQKVIREIAENKIYGLMHKKKQLNVRQDHVYMDYSAVHVLWSRFDDANILK